MRDSSSYLCRVQPARGDVEEEVDYISDTFSNDEAVPRTDSEMEEYEDDTELHSEGGRDDDDSEKSKAEEDADPIASLATVSFGTLHKALTTLPPKKSKQTPMNIAEVKGSPTSLGRASNAQGWLEKSSREKRQSFKKASKNAPAEMSSKKPVSRKREAVPVPSTAARDPRFDRAMGEINEQQFQKNYNFLKEYQASEIRTLKEEMKKTKDNDLKEHIKSKIQSMESKRQAEQAKVRAAELLCEHKRKEKELVKKGKRPYFLPQSEQKKIIMMDRYSKLDEKQLDRVIEKKRKRQAAKQRKNMPWARRNVN